MFTEDDDGDELKGIREDGMEDSEYQEHGCRQETANLGLSFSPSPPHPHRAGVFMASNYKVEKVAFVSGMSGSSIGHINLVSAVALVS